MSAIFVVTGPSGAGKSTICREAILRLGSIKTTISHTTRLPRGAEKHGVHYHFVDKDRFERILEEDGFVEWAIVHGNYYGTSVSEIRAIQNDGFDVILEIDGQGAMQIREKFPEAILIFILPPALDEFRERLTTRGEDTSDEIERRLAKVQYEIGFIENFDFLVINDELERAIKDFRMIIEAQRLTVKNTWPAVKQKYKATDDI